MITERVYISTPTPHHNNYGVQISCTNKKKLEKFHELFRALFNEEVWHWFWQGGHDLSQEWIYYELWVNPTDLTKELQDKLIELANKIADQLQLPFDII